ncbi:hypothetical protein AX16_002726 [Volvariella volvacea WC 439]|nr:hypothetical protein AX16_002726 [Volvariella volvacea WC 439]
MIMYDPTPPEEEVGADCDEDGYGGGEDVTEHLIMVVNEGDLEAARSRYETIMTEHVYSVGPSRLIDGVLITHPTETVREIDNKNGEEWAHKVGRLTCPNIKLCPIEAPKMLPFRRTSTGGPGRTTAAGPTAGPSKPAAKTDKDAKDAKKPEAAKETAGKKFTIDNKNKAPVAKHEEPAENKQKRMTFFQPKKSNSAKTEEKAEDSKVKGKGKEKEKEKKEQVTDRETDAEKAGAKTKTKVAAASKSAPEEPKRGTKRKISSAPHSDDDSDQPAAPVASSKPSKAPAVRVQRNVVMSSDEDEGPAPKAAQSRKSRAAARDEELAQRELKSMMELDDDKVIKESRRTASNNMKWILSDESEAESEHLSAGKEEEDEFQPMGLASDRDVEMEDATESKPKPKRVAKPKKVIPVGRNGLKKKRVMKSRTNIDDKGYIITEDYSSYESVDEEEPEPVKPKKGKGKAKETKETKEAEKTEAEEKKPITVGGGDTSKLKGRPSGAHTETEPEEDAAPPKPAAKAKPLAKSGPSKSGNGNSSTKASAKLARGQKSINNFFAPAKK